MPLSNVGVHPDNRGGMCPMPSAVRGLGLRLMASGFDEKERERERERSGMHGVSVDEMHRASAPSMTAVAAYHT